VAGPLRTPAPGMPRKVPFPHMWQGTPGVRRHGRPLLTGATNIIVQFT
jgi:hypothetical protein